LDINDPKAMAIISSIDQSFSKILVEETSPLQPKQKKYRLHIPPKEKRKSNINTNTLRQQRNMYGISRIRFKNANRLLSLKGKKQQYPPPKIPSNQSYARKEEYKTKNK